MRILSCAGVTSFVVNFIRACLPALSRIFVQDVDTYASDLLMCGTQCCIDVQDDSRSCNVGSSYNLMW